MQIYLYKKTTAKEALNLLLTSERIHIDLKDWITEGGKEMLALREFGEKLNDDLEFRGFVYNNKLTALTQYDQYIKFEHIIKNKDKYEKMINDYWTKNIKELAKKMPVLCYHSSYNSNVVGRNIKRVYSWYDIYNKIKNGNLK